MARLLGTEEYQILIRQTYPVVIGGYSGLGYEDPGAVRQKIRDVLNGLMAEHGDQLLVVSGGTEAGIGLAYEVAKEFRLPTLGIVSERASQDEISRFCDSVYFVSDPDGTWEVKNADGDSCLVEAARNSQMFYFGGGDVAGKEIQEARTKGIPVTVFPCYLPDPARAKAKTNKSQ